MPSINKLCSQLGIRHPLDQSTCIGYGQKKPTCGNAVAIASRTSALDILTSIERDLRAGRPPSTSDLNMAASLLLCKRWHQYQAHENVCDWEQKLKSWSSSSSSVQSMTSSSRGDRQISDISLDQYEESARTLQKKHDKLRSKYDALKNNFESLQNRFSSLQDDHEDLQDDHQSLREAHDRLEDMNTRIRSLNDEVILAELRRRLEGDTNTPLEGAVVELAMTLTAASGDQQTDMIIDSNEAQTQQNQSDDESNEESHSETENASDSDSNSESETEREDNTSNHPSEDPANSLATIRQARIAALSHDLNISETIEEPTAPSELLSPIRQSHLECSICIQPYGDDSTGYWECQSCQNRVHDECFDAWAASQERNSRTRCIFCRTEV